MSRGDNESPHSTQRTGAKKGQGMHPPDQNLHTIMGDSKDRLKEDQEHGSQREATVDQRRPAKPPPMRRNRRWRRSSSRRTLDDGSPRNFISKISKCLPALRESRTKS